MHTLWCRFAIPKVNAECVTNEFCAGTCLLCDILFVAFLSLSTRSGFFQAQCTSSLQPEQSGYSPRSKILKLTDSLKTCDGLLRFFHRHHIHSCMAYAKVNSRYSPTIACFPACLHGGSSATWRFLPHMFCETSLRALVAHFLPSLEKIANRTNIVSTSQKGIAV